MVDRKRGHITYCLQDIFVYRGWNCYFCPLYSDFRPPNGGTLITEKYTHTDRRTGLAWYIIKSAEFGSGCQSMVY